MGNFIDRVGQRFGRLTVIGLSERLPKGKSVRIMWRCLCDCGNTKEVEAYNLKSNTQSCGCLRNDRVKDTLTTHGEADTPLYRVWNSMIQRCTNESSVSYSRYGGRGITVSAEWRTYAKFKEDMGDRPEGMTLDRIDNEGNYCKGNVRWASRKDQARNTRRNAWHTYEGLKMVASEFAEKLGVGAGNLSKWKQEGLTDEQIIVKASNLRAGIRVKPGPKPGYKPKQPQARPSSNFVFFTDTTT